MVTKKDCKLSKDCNLAEESCPACHRFESVKGSLISSRLDKPPKRKYKPRGKDDLQVNPKEFVNWNEDAIYC